MIHHHQEKRQTLLRSFGKRQGRTLNSTKRQYLKDTLSDFLLHDSQMNPNPSDKKAETESNRKWSFCDLWRQEKEDSKDRKVLEIGFGSGEYMLSTLARDDRCYFLGSEVYKNGIASFISTMVRNDLAEKFKTRLRIFPDDIRLLLPALADDVFDEVVILFPDPWHKKRHRKRRLLQVEFLDEIGRVLKSDGALNIASDHEDAMCWMLAKLREAGWRCAGGNCGGNCGGQEGDSLENYQVFPEDWVMTRYQEKAALEGRKSYFVKAIKVTENTKGGTVEAVSSQCQ